MKAWTLHNIDDFRLDDVEMPVIAENEVLVEVKATGICGSDIPRVYKTGTYSYPLVPGHEFSGVVKQTGTAVDEKWKGKRVGVFPLVPCKRCIPCKNKQYEMCRNYSYLGSRRDGGFAEYVAVPVENLLKLPDNISYEVATMLEPMAVVVHAMRRVTIETTDTVVVCGLGTIGILLFMFLMEAGIKNILVIGNKEFQKQIVLRLGISDSCYCDSKAEDVRSWIMKHTAGVGADVFFECVGNNETVALAVDLAAPAGQICFIGNPYSDMTLEKAVYWKILRNQLTVTGTWNSSFEDDWHYVLEKLEQKKISPEMLISHRFSLDDIEQGFHIMRDKTEDYIKIMMKTEAE